MSEFTRNGPHDDNGVRDPVKPDDATAPLVVQMVVTFTPSTGQFNVGGIPPNMVTALGMLEMAKDVVKRILTEQLQPKPRIVGAPPGLSIPRNQQ